MEKIVKPTFIEEVIFSNTKFMIITLCIFSILAIIWVVFAGSLIIFNAMHLTNDNPLTLLLFLIMIPVYVPLSGLIYRKIKRKTFQYFNKQYANTQYILYENKIGYKKEFAGFINSREILYKDIIEINYQETEVQYKYNLGSIYILHRTKRKIEYLAGLIDVCEASDLFAELNSLIALHNKKFKIKTKNLHT